MEGHASAYHDGRCVYVSGQIGATLHHERRQLRELFLADGSRPILIMLSSVGGSVLGGLAMLDEIATLRQQGGATINGVVQGYAMSMATAILQACTHRVCGPHTVLMIHGITMVVGGDLVDIWADVNMAQQVNRTLSRLYAARTEPVGGRTEAQWFDLFQSNVPTYLSAEEALAWGLVDEIVSPLL